MFNCCCTENDTEGAELIAVDVHDSLEEAPPVYEPESQKEEAKPELVKEEPKEEPKTNEPAPQVSAGPHTFEISVVKDGPLGIMLDIKAAGVNVVHVSAGCVQTYNAKADPDKCLEKFDYIVDINGKTSCKSMLGEVTECKGTVTLKVVRPVQWTVKLVKNGKPFGAGLSFDKDSVSIEVTEIRDGTLKEFNASASPDLQIKPFDSIIKVNGIGDSPNQMIEALKTLPELELTVIRLPGA